MNELTHEKLFAISKLRPVKGRDADGILTKTEWMEVDTVVTRAVRYRTGSLIKLILEGCGKLANKMIVDETIDLPMPDVILGGEVSPLVVSGLKLPLTYH